jgi:alkylation response protein AidB-like acyl-CoA dehydrogenase
MTFNAPVRDLLFTLTEIVGIEQLFPLSAFEGLDLETVNAVLEGGAALADGVLAPLNRTGDIERATYANGAVTVPPGFAAAMKAFGEGGWAGLSADPAFGGQGLPKALEQAVFEMFHAANMAFTLCPTLTQGAVEAIHAHGSERQKALFLPPMIAGRWTGAMNLTEPQAGSDLGALRTRAEPDGDGGYKLFGEKIFITWGDHDAAENIVHLVLARLPDAPAGSRGISLFLAPKRLVAEDGALGEANALRPGRIEDKLGIHASPTCLMQYEGARAELVGQPNQGLAAMFTMMNAARLQVGAQGVGCAERAGQLALAYALERRQGRSAWTGEAAAPIFDHPDVRRMLATIRAKTAAARAICLTTACCADLARHAADPAERAAAALRNEVLTPIAKAWSTDIGVEAASLGVQVHGGMGYVEETGAAQILRDARIAPIYEGTNGIQAIDLVGRKLAMAGGEGLRALLREAGETAAALAAHPDARAKAVGAGLAAAVAAAGEATDWLAARINTPEALAGADAYLTLMGETLGGWLLAKGMLAALDGRVADADYAAGRIGLAVHLAETSLTMAPARLAAATAGAGTLEVLNAAALA